MHIQPLELLRNLAQCLGQAVTKCRVIGTSKRSGQQRAVIGAQSSRLESAITNLQIGSENLSASRGRITDTDFAVETATLARQQILQQAGNAMVVQANQMPQGVLALLRT